MSVRLRVRKLRFVERPPAPEEFSALHRVADRHVWDFEAAFDSALDVLRRNLRLQPELLAEFLAQDAVEAAIPWDVFSERLEERIRAILLTIMASAVRVVADEFQRDVGWPVTVLKQEDPFAGIAEEFVASDAAQTAAAGLPWRRIRPGEWELVAPGNQLFRAVREADGWVLRDASGLLLSRHPTLQAAMRGFAGVARQLEIGLAVRFDLTNPRAVAFASTQSATLVRQVTAETQAGIRQIVAAGQQGQLTVRDQARAIRQFIGLTDRQAQAVMNFRGALIAEGVSPERVKQLTQRQFQRAVNQRARLIARTETMQAANTGQQELWRQATDQGLLNPTQTKRRWVTQGVFNPDNPCPICRPMDRQERGLEELFESPFNGMRALHPPIHPACVCSVTLVPESLA